MQLGNIYRLGIKELWSLARDPVMLLLVGFAFTVSVYTGAAAMPETLSRAPIAIVDEDQSPLSQRIIAAFQAPYFLPPKLISQAEMDERMDAGLDTFALNIPPKFQQDVVAGNHATMQLNIDATRMTQAFTGNGYVQAIVRQEVQEFANRYRAQPSLPVELSMRMRFNPTLNKGWFGAIMQVINQITMLSIILTGTALIRERERGTIEHLLAMPVTPLEIMVSKVWSMGLVVLAASIFSLFVVVQGVLAVPVNGSIALFLVGATLHLFATTSMGILMGTFARSMPQFGLLVILVLLPLQMLSGSMTPRESMPEVVQTVMLTAPTTHFVQLAQSVLYRDAGLRIVWPQFVALICIGMVFFYISQSRFRKVIGTMA